MFNKTSFFGVIKSIILKTKLLNKSFNNTYSNTKYTLDDILKTGIAWRDKSATYSKPNNPYMYDLDYRTIM